MLIDGHARAKTKTAPFFTALLPAVNLWPPRSTFPHGTWTKPDNEMATATSWTLLLLVYDVLRRLLSRGFVEKVFAGQVNSPMTEMGGTSQHGTQFGMTQFTSPSHTGPGDIFSHAYGGGGGFGDVLDRVPINTAADLRSGYLMRRNVRRVIEREGRAPTLTDAMAGTARQNPQNPQNRVIRPGDIAAPAVFLSGEGPEAPWRTYRFRAAHSGAGKTAVRSQ